MVVRFRGVNGSLLFAKVRLFTKLTGDHLLDPIPGFGSPTFDQR